MGRDQLEALAEIAAGFANASGGAFSVARTLGGALGCSAVVRDPAGAIVVVAARSSLEESSITSRTDLDEHRLTVAGEWVGTVAFAWHGEPADPQALEVAIALLAGSVAASAQGDGTGADADELAGWFAQLLEDGPDAPEPELLEVLAERSGDAVERCLLIVRAQAITPLDEGWRERLLQSVRAAAIEAQRDAVVIRLDLGGDHGALPAVVVPGDAGMATTVAGRVARALEEAASTLRAVVGTSRVAADLRELTRARDEALLAANVALADGEPVMAFEATGSYRLLLPALSSGAGELERFYEETVAPLSEYDRQYQTELLRTVEAFLDNDGNVAATAHALFTHRHTIRYRLERVKELAGLDVGSSEGREQLSLGLKAMRVLGITHELTGEPGDSVVTPSRSRANRRT